MKIEYYTYAMGKSHLSLALPLMYTRLLFSFHIIIIIFLSFFAFAYFILFGCCSDWGDTTLDINQRGSFYCEVFLRILSFFPSAWVQRCLLFGGTWCVFATLFRRTHSTRTHAHKDECTHTFQHTHNSEIISISKHSLWFVVFFFLFGLLYCVAFWQIQFNRPKNVFVVSTLEYFTWHIRSDLLIIIFFCVCRCHLFCHFVELYCSHRCHMTTLVFI